MFRRLQRSRGSVAPRGGPEPERGTSHHITVDYPVNPRPRYGHGQPPHPGLEAQIAQGRARYRELLSSVVELREHLWRIPVADPSTAREPCWVNGWLPGLDAATLYAILVHRGPRLYLEVGSGNSTKFARRAIDDHGLHTRIVSIDPSPRADVDDLCDEVIRSPLEEADLAVLDSMVAGDVLFVDNSHRVFQNSDATVLFLDVLPRLPADVAVELHDIFLPEDYPEAWLDRYYSEQYLLAAYLLGGGGRITTELPAWYVSNDPELAGIMRPLWSHPAMAGVEAHGHSYWLRSPARP